MARYAAQTTVSSEKSRAEIERKARRKAYHAAWYQANFARLSIVQKRRYEARRISFCVPPHHYHRWNGNTCERCGAARRKEGAGVAGHRSP